MSTNLDLHITGDGHLYMFFHVLLFIIIIVVELRSQDEHRSGFTSDGLGDRVRPSSCQVRG